MPRFSDITPTQYDAAYAWLGEAGLLNNLHSSVPARLRIYSAFLAHNGASWLPDADALVCGPDELPEDALRTADGLGINPEAAYGQLKAVWGKVDSAERERIGAAGELALVDLLSSVLSAKVEHVAAWSDGYGYDIAVSDALCTAHLEIKTTVRRGRLSVHLTRNEYEVMRRDPCWELVAVRLGASRKPEAVATVPRDWLAKQVPADRGSRGRWEACRLDVPPDVPIPGIPAIAPLLAEGASDLLTGEYEWPGWQPPSQWASPAQR
ncbi:protein NO VEIN domain-containing protein [Streptomyces rimosus]|uniref:protein NO VEIN domain-containing protein n=1 Tax=Streptomyces rimosus TaxID=1927 RepID=UPI00131AB9B6|nr:DUF3883 domain-containing protein [Streptomyces rimosus]